MFIKLILPIIILILSILPNITSSLIPEENFIHLQSYTPFKFSLESQSKEVYFSFNNSNPKGDVAIHFAKSKGFTVEIFIYTSLDEIQRLDNGNYTSSTWHFNLNSQKLFYIESTDSKQKQGIYYIIIKDTHGYYFDDYIEMFNEFDIIPLLNRKPYVIQRIFSQKKYTFSFEGVPNEIIQINVISQNETHPQKISVVNRDNVSEIILEETNVHHIQKEINVDINTSKNYLMIISLLDNDDIYNEMIKNVMISKYVDSKIFLNENEIYEYNYIGNETFYFYFNLNNYTYNEENVITAFIDNQIIENNYYKGFFCKFETAESDTSLLPLFPKTSEENECNVELADDYDTYYHLYFKNNKSHEEGKQLFLLVSIIIEPNFQYIPPKRLSISLSAKMNHRKMDSKTNDFISLSLLNYVPYYIHYTFDINKHESFVLYSSIPRLFRTYIGNLTTSEGSINTLVNTNQLFSLSNYRYSNINEVIVKLFGSMQNESFYIESTNGEILYYNDTRPNGKAFSFFMENCIEPKYIIGNYEEESTSWLYIEELYGNFTLEYKNKFDDNNTYQPILPSIENEINKTLHLMDTNMDIIGIQCSIPGHLNVYIIDNKVPSQLKDNSKTVLRLTADASADILLTTITDNTEILSIEFYTPYDHEVTIVIQDNEYKLEETTHLIRIAEPLVTYDEGTEITASLISKENTIVEIIVITTKDLYKTVKDEITEPEKLTDQNLLFLLDSTTIYSDYSININGLSEDMEFYYTLEHSPMELVDSVFIPLPQNSGITEKHSLKDTKGAINFTFTNPYDKYQSTGFYYVTISFTSKPATEYELTFTYNEKPTYEQLEQNTIGFISNMENKTSILQITEDKDVENYLLIYLTKCGNKPSNLNTKYYNQTYNTTILSKSHSVLFLHNPGTELQFELTYLSDIDEAYYGLYITYLFHNRDHEVDYSLLEQFNNETLSYNNKTKMISWKKTSAKTYTLFIMEENEEREKYKDNLCYLETIGSKGNGEGVDIQVLEDVTEYKLTKNGTFIVNVVAYFNGTTEVKGVYQSIKVHISETDPSYDKWFNDKILLIVLGIFVVVVTMAIIIIVIRLKKRNLESQEEPGPLMNNSLLEKD